MSHSRPDWDEYFMGISREVATRATCDRGRNGCVIVKDKRIVATGYVGAPAGLKHCDEEGHLMKEVYDKSGQVTKHCVRTTHAEQNAIAQAAKFGVSVDGGTLYTKMEPCLDCAKLLINAGIKRIVANKRYHAGELSRQFLKEAGVELVVLTDEVEKYDEQ
jgi:dCMP deaminase